MFFVPLRFFSCLSSVSNVKKKNHYQSPEPSEIIRKTFVVGVLTFVNLQNNFKKINPKYSPLLPPLTGKESVVKNFNLTVSLLQKFKHLKIVS